MAGAEWFYGKDNKQHGPLSAAQLKQLAQEGTLRPADLVWREGMDEWTAASKVKGLFDEAPPAPPKAAAPAPAPPKAAAPKPAASRPAPQPDATPVFADSPDAPPLARQGPAPHLLDTTLEYVRGRFTDRFIDATDKLFTLGGHYGLYAGMVLLLVFGLIGGVKMNSLNAVLGALAWVVGLAVLQYAAGRFFKSLDELNQSTSGTLGSTVVPDCFALLAMIVGVVALLGLSVAGVQTGTFLFLLPAIVIFVLAQYVAAVAVNHGTLNIVIDPEARAGEEALGVFSFAIKVWLRLVPVAFGVGVVCGVLLMMGACGLLLMVPGVDTAEAAPDAAMEAPMDFGNFDMESPEAATAVAALSALAASQTGTWLLIGSAALPLVAYLLFIFAHLAIDVIRAVLAVPVKLDALGQAKEET